MAQKLELPLTSRPQAAPYGRLTNFKSWPQLRYCYNTCSFPPSIMCLHTNTPLQCFNAPFIVLNVSVKKNQITLQITTKRITFLLHFLFAMWFEVTFEKKPTDCYKITLRTYSFSLLHRVQPETGKRHRCLFFF